MKRTWATAARGLVTALALGWVGWSSAGCSTTYQPRKTGRVALGIKHASAVFVKNGNLVSIGPFTGELEGLVADVPTAAAYAHRAHTQFMIGVPAYLTGVGGVIIGVVLLSGPVGWIVIGSGVSVLGTGLGFMGAGFTNAVDAVNMHNDVVSETGRRSSTP